MSKNLNCVQVAKGLVEVEDMKNELLKSLHSISTKYNDDPKEIFDRLVETINATAFIVFRDGSLDWYVNDFIPQGTNTLEQAELSLKEIKKMEKEMEERQCNQNCENCTCKNEEKDEYAEEFMETSKEIMNLILETNKTLLELSIRRKVSLSLLVEIFTDVHKRMANDGVFFESDLQEKDDVKQSDQEQN